MVISTTGAFMFSSKSICDNMLSKSETDYKTTNKNIESSEFNKVEIQSYNNEGNNNA